MKYFLAFLCLVISCSALSRSCCGIDASIDDSDYSLKYLTGVDGWRRSNSLQFKMLPMDFCGLIGWNGVKDAKSSNSILGANLLMGGALVHSVNVVDYGADLTGKISSHSAFMAADKAAGGGCVVVPRGRYKMGTVARINLVSPFLIESGALMDFNAAEGQVVFEGGVYAPKEKLFIQPRGFIADQTINPLVVIKRVSVQVDWFVDKSTHKDRILEFPDQANNIMAAFRAAVGDWYERTPNNWRNDNVFAVLEFGSGCYRVDKTLYFGSQTAGGANPRYHRLDGCSILGSGPGSTCLIRTEMKSTDTVIHAETTGLLSTFASFTVTAYNPNGASSKDKYACHANSLFFLIGDSNTIRDLWLSGAQVEGRVDSSGFKRGGVGLQLHSVIDTCVSNLVVEYCVTALACSSTRCNISNVSVFESGQQAFGLGNYRSEYPDIQNAFSDVNLVNLNATTANVFGISVLERGGSQIRCNNIRLDGFEYQNGPPVVVGDIAIFIGPSATLAGSMSGVLALNVSTAVFGLGDGGGLGKAGNSFIISGLSVKNLSFAAGGSIFMCDGPRCSAFFSVYGLSAEIVKTTLLRAPITGDISMCDVHLVEYVGQFDLGVSRILFHSGGANLNIKNVVRSNNDQVVLTQYGFAQTGFILIDSAPIANAIREVGGRATVIKPAYIGF